MRRLANALMWLALPGVLAISLAEVSRSGRPGVDAGRHQPSCGVCQTRGEALPDEIGPETVVIGRLPGADAGAPEVDLPTGARPAR